MDSKAIKGYLVGYDGDERYRIYIKEEHKVVLSRDVQFREKMLSCEETVKLPFCDFKPNNHHYEYEANDNSASMREIYTEHRTNQDEELNVESDEEIEDQGSGSTKDDDVQTNKRTREEDSDEDLPIIKRLRDRSLIATRRFQDYVMMANDFVNRIETPTTYREAVNSKEKVDWEKAMNSEIKSLQENQTWELSTLPKENKAIPCKWVYRVKTNADGSIEKFKARLVIKGFSQRKGIDYNQTFSPVARMGTIRSFLSIAASEQLHLTQFDVSTAFLYGELEESIYMKQPEGYEDDTERVCKLKRSLYGLKQAPRCWNKRFGSFLISLGFRPSEADPCLFLREKRGKKLMLVLYVDDGLVAGSDPIDIEDFIGELKSEFKIVSKSADYFLGLEIEKKDEAIKISQKSYAKKVLERFNFEECKPVATPMLKAAEVQITGKVGEEIQFPYREAVGAIMYLMLGTRPDLAFSVGFSSRSLDKPTSDDVTRVKRMLRYIAGTIDVGITYSRKVSRRILECYSDADFGGCTKTGRSTSGVVVKYAGGVISWLSKRQTMVATSTTEAEIVAANEAAKEVIWLSRLFNEIVKLQCVPVLQVDNTAAVRLAENPEFHRRTKHIEMKHFFIREKVAEGKIRISQISTEEQVADIMTKPLSRTRLTILCGRMGVQ